MLYSLSKLESLSLGYFGSPPKLYPSAISFSSSLKKLSLSCLRLHWREISAIGQLPNLEVLKLYENAFVGEMWNLEEEEFLNLKYLKMHKSDVVQWIATSESFPCLQQLRLEYCYYLEEIPPCFGTISTLNMIRVDHCSTNAISSAWQIVNDQRDYGNEDLQVRIGTPLSPAGIHPFDLNYLKEKFVLEDFHSQSSPGSTHDSGRRMTRNKIPWRGVRTAVKRLPEAMKMFQSFVSLFIGQESS